MKYLPLKIIILCIILPPISYWGVVNSLEKYLKSKYKVEIENIYTGDTRELYNGNINVKDAVNHNIDNYLPYNLNSCTVVRVLAPSPIFLVPGV